MSFAPISVEEDKVGRAVVNACFRIHKELGPGLLEKVYEVCLCHELKKSGLFVERQVTVPIFYGGLQFPDSLRIDLRVERKVIVEVKAVETMNDVWQAQILSHLKMTGLRLGYLVNFNVSLMKDGIRRFVI